MSGTTDETMLIAYAEIFIKNNQQKNIIVI